MLRSAGLVLLLFTSTSAFGCFPNPCQNGGTCESQDHLFEHVPGDFICNCRAGFTGAHCEDNNFKNLTGTCSDFPKGECGKGTCVMDNGKPKCSCPPFLSGHQCQERPIRCLDYAFCDKNAANKICDPACNNPECGYDSGDCRNSDPDSIAVIVKLPASKKLDETEKLGTILSNLTKTRLSILKDNDGQVELFGYDAQEYETKERIDPKKTGYNYSYVKMILDTEKMELEQLFELQAKILKLSEAYNLPIPAAVVQGPRPALPPIAQPFWPLFIAAVGVAIVIFALKGYVEKKRRSRHSSDPVTWYPNTLPFSHKAQNVNKGATDISAIVSSWFLTPSSFLAEIAVSQDEQALIMKLNEETDSLDAKNVDGLTAIALAVDRGFVRLLSALLTKGADPNIKDSRGFTPLHRAVQARSTVMVQALLNSGVSNGAGRIQDPNCVTSDNESPLMLYAKYVHNHEIGRLLIQKGAKVSFTGIVNSLGAFHKKTALHFAAQANNVTAVEVLSTAVLENSDKFDVNAVDVRNRTPLIIAAEYGSQQVCEKLIALGADKSLEDDMKKTAEIYARESAFPYLSEYLKNVPCIQIRRKRASGGDGNEVTKKKGLQERNPNVLPSTYARYTLPTQGYPVSVSAQGWPQAATPFIFPTNPSYDSSQWSYSHQGFAPQPTQISQAKSTPNLAMPGSVYCLPASQNFGQQYQNWAQNVSPPYCQQTLSPPGSTYQQPLSPPAALPYPYTQMQYPAQACYQT
ncbi:hypothetical protein L596_010135 [Steinernema carpocapsae]|uniref:EGF-like domain-containing protein n=1 Tax=Steinernema carpocapsae TaxID=34508 RepID=A0A4U5PHM3_STECR|nr:hypothetical protein L596_010135 [Steinernema carpocapsae]